MSSALAKSPEPRRGSGTCLRVWFEKVSAKKLESQTRFEEFMIRPIGHITMTCPVGYRERTWSMANPLAVGTQRDAGDGVFEKLNKIEK